MHTDTEEMTSGFGSLVDLLKKLQTIFLTTSSLDSDNNVMIDLPQIVVIGSQSAGKSSVMEALMGCDILPRGNGIVTRCPIVLQLQRLHEDCDTSFYVEFNSTDKTFETPKEARDEIESQMKTLTEDETLSQTPILIRIFSKAVVNLTMVDLPGYIKIPLSDQPDGIENLVEDIIMNFIENENCIILAVTTATTDIAASDALNLARRVDPLGERTIGVITKCDTEQDTSRIVEALSNKLYKLQRGYVAMVCRNRTQTKDGMSIEESLKFEEEFFTTRRQFNSVQHLCGTNNLSRILHNSLVANLEEKMPAFRSHLSRLYEQTRAKLLTYGVDTSKNSAVEKYIMIHTVISKYVNTYETCIYGGVEAAMDTKDITGGARIRSILDVTLADSTSKVSPMTNVDADTLSIMLKNNAGLRSGIFLREELLEQVLKTAIMKLEPLALATADSVHSEMLKVHKDVEKCVKIYPNLRHSVSNIVLKYLEELLMFTKTILKHIFEMETSYIDAELKDLPSQEAMEENAGTQHYDSNGSDYYYNQNRRKEVRNNNQVTALQLSQSNYKTRLLTNVVNNYFNRTTQRILECSKKAIVAFLIRPSIEKLEAHLIANLFINEQQDVLLEIDPKVQQRRLAAELQLEQISKAQALIQTVCVEE